MKRNTQKTISTSPKNSKSLNMKKITNQTQTTRKSITMKTKRRKSSKKKRWKKSHLHQRALKQRIINLRISRLTKRPIGAKRKQTLQQAGRLGKRIRTRAGPRKLILRVSRRKNRKSEKKKNDSRN